MDRKILTIIVISVSIIIASFFLWINVFSTEYPNTFEGENLTIHYGAKLEKEIVKKLHTKSVHGNVPLTGTIYLKKEDGSYIINDKNNKLQRDEEMRNSMKLMPRIISGQVFQGSPVTYRILDDNGEVLKSFSEAINHYENGIYFKDKTPKKYLPRLKEYFNNTQIFVQKRIGKPGYIVEVTSVYTSSAELSEKAKRTYQISTNQLNSQVFEGEGVVLKVINWKGDILKTYTAAPTQ